MHVLNELSEILLNHVPTLCSLQWTKCVILSMHPGAIPSLAGAANQINILKKELKLEKVFLASDAPKHGTS